jgi:hypothetical protein
MRKLAYCFLVALFVTQGAATLAQTQDEQAAGFTLTLSLGRHSGEFSKDTQVLVVRLTNISKEVNYEDTCSAFGGLYNLRVVYNGVPLEETDKHRNRRKALEQGPCNGSNPGRRTKTGESREDRIYYETTKPGTYDFTVEREGFPGNPEKSVTVKSNTLTIVVPEPGEAAPQ